MKCGIRKIGSATLFSLRGDLIFGQLDGLREAVKGEMLQSTTGKFLIIDMAGMDKIDSAGIGVLITVYKAVIARNGTLAIIRPNDTVKRILERARLIPRIFKIYENENEVIKAM